MRNTIVWKRWKQFITRIGIIKERGSAPVFHLKLDRLLHRERGDILYFYFLCQYLDKWGRKPSNIEELGQA